MDKENTGQQINTKRKRQTGRSKNSTNVSESSSINQNGCFRTVSITPAENNDGLIIVRGAGGDSGIGQIEKGSSPALRITQEPLDAANRTARSMTPEDGSFMLQEMSQGILNRSQASLNSSNTLSDGFFDNMSAELENMKDNLCFDD